MNISQDELKRQHIFKQLESIKSDAIYEKAIITTLLMDKELLDLEATTQKNKTLSTGDIRIDLFYTHLNLAIEIDEDHHEQTTDEDFKRDQELQNNFGFTTHRIRLWGKHKEESLWDKIADCKNQIIKLRDTIKPVHWNLSQHSLSCAKKDHKNMIFRKINNSIFINNEIDFNVKIHQNIMQNPLIDTLNIGIYTGQTCEVATVITIPKDALQTLSGGNYRVHGYGYINEEHPLNQSGFTDSNWANGKSTIYSDDLELIVNPGFRQAPPTN